MKTRTILAELNLNSRPVRFCVWKSLRAMSRLAERFHILPLLQKVSRYSGMRVLLRRADCWARCNDAFHRAAIGYICPASESILDVGCGEAYYLASVDRFKIGIDIWRPKLERAKAFCSDVVQSDLRAKLPFRDKCFDTVLCVEVIEHLEKDQGLRLFEELSRVAKRKIIITTPRGFLPQKYHNMPYETHRSGWVESELHSLGYIVLLTLPVPPCTIYRRELA